jgi:hypothetical protein
MCGDSVTFFEKTEFQCILFIDSFTTFQIIDILKVSTMPLTLYFNDLIQAKIRFFSVIPLHDIPTLTDLGPEHRKVLKQWSMGILICKRINVRFDIFFCSTGV